MKGRLDAEVLALDCAAETDRIAARVAGLVQGMRRRGAVLGVSGGVDSAVCAALLTQALGPSRVLPLLMPERESSASSRELGLVLCESLGLTPIVQDITGALAALSCYGSRDEAIRAVFPDYGEGWRSKIVIGGGLSGRHQLLPPGGQGPGRPDPRAAAAAQGVSADRGGAELQAAGAQGGGVPPRGPAAYKGRIVVLDDALEIVTWGMATEGLNPDQVTKENLAKVRPVLAKWLPLVKVYDSDSPKTALLNGDVDLGVVWSGEAAILIKEDPKKFKYVLPKEGAHMFIDSLAIPKSAENVAAAHKFLDYVMRPDVSKTISDDFPYTNPNLEARKLLSDADRANEASYPPGDPKLTTFRDIGTLAADVDKMFTDLKASSGS